MKLKIKRDLLVDFFKKCSAQSDVHVVVRENQIQAVGCNSNKTMIYRVAIDIEMIEGGVFNIIDIPKFIKFLDRFDDDIVVGLNKENEIVVKDTKKTGKYGTCEDVVVSSWWGMSHKVQNPITQDPIACMGKEFPNGVCLPIGSLVGMIKDASIINMEFYLFSTNQKTGEFIGKIEKGRDVIQTSLGYEKSIGDPKLINTLVSDCYRLVVDAVKNTTPECWVMFGVNMVMITDQKSFWYAIRAEDK